MSSSSHAAALAAFNGLTNKSKSEVIHDKKKPLFKIPMPSNSIKQNEKNPPGTIKRVESYKKGTPPTMQRTSTLQSIKRPVASKEIQSNDSSNHQSPGSSSSSASAAAIAAASAVPSTPRGNMPISKSSTTPINQQSRAGSTAVSILSSDPDTSNITTTSDYFAMPTSNQHKIVPIKKSSSQHSSLSVNSAHLPQDMIQNVKNSIESKLKLQDLSSKNRTNEMISQVRQSINSKSKTGANQSLEIAQKNQDRLNEIRKSIDMKRISTVSTPSIRPPPTSGGSVYERSSFHNSYSSLGSTLSDNDVVSLPMTPKIVVDLHDRPEEHADDESGHDNERLEVQQSHSLPVSPMRSSESIVHEIKNSGGPRRKPPPMYLQDEDSDSAYAMILTSPGSRSYEVFSSKSSFEGNTDRSDKPREGSTGSGVSINSTKLPQFPNIIEKHGKSKSNQAHKHHIFKSKYKIKGVDTSVNLLSDDDDSENNFDEYIDPTETEVAPTRPTGIVAPQQSVHLKTTMRKTNKRKEKKLQFSEYKPWKNHKDLAYVSESERKRYEGLWVSNKGLYMSSVVTRLTGVDYSKKEEEIAQDRVLTEEETSLQAARLSTKVTKDINSQVDPQNFHNLLSVEIGQLMHGVVVKRIWKRSKLPNETLEAIWNLVDFRHDGSLNKPEFLVGMWLVDQCLYGRKLPKKVDAVVWDNLGSIGVNVVVKKKGRR
ncbi:increased rDNA silencing protein 4 [[Candida] anglica]